jgi:hypothetical protein
MTTTVKYGDVVEYVNYAGVHRIARVSAVVADIKDGRPGFDGVLQVQDADGTYRDSDEPFRSVWGLDEQLVRVLRPASGGPALFTPGHRLGSAWR